MRVRPRRGELLRLVMGATLAPVNLNVAVAIAKATPASSNGLAEPQQRRLQNFLLAPIQRAMLCTNDNIERSREERHAKLYATPNFTNRKPRCQITLLSATFSKAKKNSAVPSKLLQITKRLSPHNASVKRHCTAPKKGAFAATQDEFIRAPLAMPTSTTCCTEPPAPMPDVSSLYKEFPFRTSPGQRTPTQ